MEKKAIGYHVALVICAVIMGLLCCVIDSQARNYQEEITQLEQYSKMGNDLENYVLDVVFETDLFEDINDEEKEHLDHLASKQDLGPYYIELIRLMGKYYGYKE